jgi:CheY-like chemotaxis protein
LQEALDYQPDCLLLDINMPAMDGCAVARRIRQVPELQRVKLVALTVYSDQTHVRRIREAGLTITLSSRQILMNWKGY